MGDGAEQADRALVAGVFGESFGLMRRAWLPLLVTAGITGLSWLPAVMDGMAQASDVVGPPSFSDAIWLTVLTPIGAITSGWAALACFEALAGRPPGLWPTLAGALRRFWPLLALSALFTLPGLALTLAAPVGARMGLGLFAGAGWPLTEYLLQQLAGGLIFAFFAPLSGPLLKEGLGGGAALARSLVLTRGARWTLGGLSVLVSLADIAVLTAASMIYPANPAAYGTLSLAWYSALGAFTTALAAVVYVRLRRRADGVAPDEVDKVFG